MPTWLAIIGVLSIPWFSSREDGKPPLAIVHIVAFLWRRATETDADKAQRLIVRSQELLEQARQLAADSQRIAQCVDDEFERRLRLVSGDKGGTP